MMTLVLLACIGLEGSVCSFTTVPALYPTLERCRMGAAMAAGLSRSQVVNTAPGSPLVYWYKCLPEEPEATTWTRVEGGRVYANVEPPF